MVNSFYKTEFAKIKYPLQIVQHMYICGPHCVYICECMLSVFAGFEIIFDSFAHVFLCFLRALSLSLPLHLSRFTTAAAWFRSPFSALFSPLMLPSSWPHDACIASSFFWCECAKKVNSYKYRRVGKWGRLERYVSPRSQRHLNQRHPYIGSGNKSKKRGSGNSRKREQIWVCRRLIKIAICNTFYGSAIGQI